ncbi:MAG TPA: single-stranded-DNA-specific exonuclease RecJ [Chryseolinea sp.]|nr:single-stranded-DNA-specific exonuclease RecJ [Chryseolinea sp.]HPH47304.1 single-stranded-DNA-specific exonuclease RecJ [Chryseolinea sp.]HPM31056.1 single-stranded-DNA-specific exonuclease RecJ [Chryseolinea sp.]
MEKRWIVREIPEREKIEQLSNALNINPSLSTILIQRGIHDFESAKHFFRPSLDHLHDPFLMKDMNLAVDRLKKAIDGNEKILVYGDYDVDGTTSVALVISYLRSFYSACEIYIPDRHVEGYGISLAGIEWAEQNQYTLVIALDCGIKSNELIQVAKRKGIDFIICDHHLPDDNIPDAVAVLDPKRKDCTYPYTELSGCGLGFKLIQAYARSFRDEHEVYQYLDLVAVSIASDIVPITDENRTLAHFGLKKLNEDPMPGLKALKEIAAIRNEMDISSIVFTLGPRINAAGRVAHGGAAVELLIAKTEEEANTLAEKVNVKNEVRKQFDSDITEEAIAMIEGSETLRSAKSTVLFKNTWHKGVIGIVASRCIEKYYRPTVILTESNDKVTGSARSVNGFDLYNAILECSDLLEKFGGHKYAAGLTLDISKVEAFQRKFEEVVSSTITEDMMVPVVDIDIPLNFNSINVKFLNVLKQMAPFGPENQRPFFVAEQVYVSNALSSFKERHLKFLGGQHGSDQVFQVVGFDMIDHYNRISNGEYFKMVFTIEENTFNGITSIQLRMKDIKFL